MGEIINFRKAKILKELQEFKSSGKIPEYFTKKIYMKTFCSLNDAINEWRLIVNNPEYDNMFNQLKNNFIAWATYTEKQNLDDYNEKIKNNFKNIIDNLATNNKNFRIVGVHNKENQKNNVILVLAEYLQHILDEKPNDRNIAILIFIDKNKIKIFEALEKDINSFKSFLKKIPNNTSYENPIIETAKHYLNNLDTAKLILRYGIQDYNKNLVSA